MSASAWGHLLAVLAAEAVVIVLLAMLLGRRVRPLWQRPIWHAAFLILFGVAVVEGFGVKGRVPSVSRARVAQPPALLWTPTTIPEPVVPVPPLTPEVSHQAAGNTYLQPPPRHLWWPAGIWLAGFLCFTARPLFARACFVISLRGQKPVSDESLLRSVNRLVRALGIRRRIRILEAAKIHGPIAFGLFRPAICLPQGFSRDFSSSEQEAMIAHELEHLRSHDPGWYLLADVVCAAWWWHPFIWWGWRSLQAASEQAADEASLLVQDGPVLLAECLVKIGQKLSISASFNSLGIEGNGFRSGLAKRVRNLLNLPPLSRPFGLRPLRSAVIHFAGGFILFTLVFLGSGWRSRERPVVPALWSAVLAQVKSQSSRQGAGISSSNPGAKGSDDAFLNWEGTTLPEILKELGDTEVKPPYPLPTEPLHTRWFKIYPDALASAITNALQITREQNAQPRITKNLEGAVPEPTRVDTLFLQLLQYFKGIGVDLAPPKNVFYNDGLGMMMVRGSLADLSMIERSLPVSNLRASIVVFEVRWAEFDAEKSEQVFNSLGLADRFNGTPVDAPPTSGLVSSPQTKIYSGSHPPLTWMRVLTRKQCSAIFRKLDGSAGVNVITGPRLLTLNDTTAHARVANETGPGLDIVTHVMADGYTLHLNVIQTAEDFVGYDLDSGKDVWDYVESAGSNADPRHGLSGFPARPGKPKPIYRLRQENARAVLWDGQTMVFWGAPRARANATNAQPLLGDLPFVGTIYRKLPENRTESLIFITPTIVDAAGKPVHKPEDMPFTENGVPQQKLK